ncbi:hypothetical protein JIX56_12615 [Streptomyces sp. CA-210063]|nr:hypothetical protein [Streptomyces sp. CA-210063]UUU30679.1 hypothetical protein JIX56_12615 [Streptomyces sp. CA-210063]
MVSLEGFFESPCALVDLGIEYAQQRVGLGIPPSEEGWCRWQR